MEDYTKGSGNVFADLGFPDAEERLAKAKLVVQIDRIIRKRRLTQEEAAKILGVSQLKISALLHGKFEAFSMDRLFKFLMDLGQNIEIHIKSKPARTTGKARRTVLSS